MLRRRYPGKKFIPPPPKRLCTIQPKLEFVFKLDQIRQDVKKILSLEKEIAMKKRPHPWNKQPKPSTNSVLNKGFPGFEYILRPLVRPSLAFGSKIPRDPTERIIKRHKLRLRKKRYTDKPKEEPKPTSEKKLVKPQPEPEFSFMPKKSKIVCQQSDSWVGKIDDTIEEEDLSEIQGFDYLYDYDKDEDLEEEEEEDSDNKSFHLPDFGFLDNDDDIDSTSYDDSQENATQISLTSWTSSAELKEMQRKESERQKARRSVASIPREKLIKMREREASRATPKLLETIQSPSPVSYTIPRFPDDVKHNMYAFNSSSPQQTLNATEVPSAAAYKIDTGDGICGVKLNSSLGGKQTIKLATMIRCLPANRNICKRCLKQPVGDFYYSKYYGALCSDCFSNEANAKTAIPHVIKSFQKARHCDFMHYHAQHNTVRTKKYKDILRSVRREAYMNLFPEITKKVKVVEAVKADWKSKCCSLHRSKHEESKKKIDPKICIQICKHKESADAESVASLNEADQDLLQLERLEMQRLSEEREYEMLVKEYAYKFMKNRLSILPIYDLIHKDDEYLFPVLGEEGADEKTDFQLKLIRRFGSEASYYGTLIPEFREKGVVHAVDPESDTYTTTAKGRQFYKATPLAWELSHDQLLDDEEILKLVGKTELEEVVKKKMKKSVRHRERDIVTPPLPGPRLSVLIVGDTHKPPRPRASKVQMEKPIISRNYNIPKSYWYNIDR